MHRPYNAHASMQELTESYKYTDKKAQVSQADKTSQALSCFPFLLHLLKGLLVQKTWSESKMPPSLAA